MGIPGASYSVEELAEAGVRRISVGSGPSRVALGAFMKATREMSDQGTFNLMSEGVGTAEVVGIFSKYGPA